MSTKRQIERAYASLVGRTIVAVEPQLFARDYVEPGDERQPLRQGYTSDPTLFFDDGSTLSFVVDETEIGEYGIQPVRYAGAHRTKRIPKRAAKRALRRSKGDA